jgi:methylated-DNA-[protein]-cysteine S-methyltransferase
VEKKMVRTIKPIQDLPDNSTFDEMDSPVGKLTIITSKKGLHAILWDNDYQNPESQKIINILTQSKNEKTIIKTKKQLSEYFQNKRTVFDLPLVLNGSDFQIQSWKQLLKIPYGKTISYAEQAQNIGDKNKARAVGNANRLNPISIVIPCHRVIGSDGKLNGFAGGVDRKAFLLKIESSCT